MSAARPIEAKERSARRLIENHPGLDRTDRGGGSILQTRTAEIGQENAPARTSVVTIPALRTNVARNAKPSTVIMIAAMDRGRMPRLAPELRPNGFPGISEAIHVSNPHTAIA